MMRVKFDEGHAHELSDTVLATEKCLTSKVLAFLAMHRFLVRMQQISLTNQEKWSDILVS